MKFTLTLFIIINFFCTPNEKDKTTDHPAPDNTDYYPENTSPLESKIRTINMTYIAWGCECANWIENDKYDHYEDENTLAQNSIFLEPADPGLGLPDTLGYSGDIIQFTGQFYSDKGYPKKYPVSEQKPEPARVFRYTSYTVVKSGYEYFKPGKN